MVCHTLWAHSEMIGFYWFIGHLTVYGIRGDRKQSLLSKLGELAARNIGPCASALGNIVMGLVWPVYYLNCI